MMTLALWIVLALVRLKPDTTTAAQPAPTDVLKATHASIPIEHSVRLQPDRGDVDRRSVRLRPDHVRTVRLQADGDAVERGRRTFMRVGCYQCHGGEAQGASTGPRLGPNPLPRDAFSRAVRTPRNEMPPYSVKILSDSDLADVYAFVDARPRPHQLAK